MAINPDIAIVIEDGYDGFYITLGGTKTFYHNQEDLASETLSKVFKYLGFKCVDIVEDDDDN